jgi:hypothetical protein
MAERRVRELRNVVFHSSVHDAVTCVTHLYRIREVAASNIGPKISYFHLGVVCFFFLVSSREMMEFHLNYADSLQTLSSLLLSSNHSMLYSQDIESIVKKTMTFHILSHHRKEFLISWLCLVRYRVQHTKHK